jgi:hypothetical protein
MTTTQSTLCYTIYTSIQNGMQQTTLTEDVKEAMSARAQGQFVLVGWSFNTGRRF